MHDTDPDDNADRAESQDDSTACDVVDSKPLPEREIGGRGGLDPSRYGDWEKAGRCIDF